jgi:hypothetical protein
MYLCPGALDAIEKMMYKRRPYIKDLDFPNWKEHFSMFHADGIMFEKIKNRITSLTRIEPPLHPPGPEKITIDFGTEPGNFNERKLLEMAYPLRWNYTHGPGDIRHDFDFSNLPKNSTTTGVFAPWCFWVDEFKEIGGHDSLFAPQSKEDSDIFNRFKLNGTEFIQTWEGFVYHLTCRGSRFAPSLTTPGKNSQEWETQNIKSSRNFIRKWGHFVKHDEYLNPIIPHKYNIGFVIKNCTYNQLYNLEIWCDSMKVDLENEIIDRYIEFEQFNVSIILLVAVLDLRRL